MAPFITGAFYLAVALLCLARPQTGCTVVGYFFWIIALGVHGYFILANPQSYVDFAHDAYVGFYRDLVRPAVEFSRRGLACFIWYLSLRSGR
ncbi:MAG TPA: hypothetical protein VF201_16185 [Nitrolancea sp.]